MPGPRRATDPEVGRQLVATVRDRSRELSRSELGTVVRFTLERLAEAAPGGTVEVRVPPYGVTQCIAGPRHTRGTPPNVVELDAETWLALATGAQSWADALGTGRVHASGNRADLSGYLPLDL